MTPYDLARRWNIGLEAAKRTLLKTTQRGLRTVPNPLLSQWYSTTYRMLRYRRLPVDLSTGILEATTFQEKEEALMDNKGKLHVWNNKRKSVDRYISILDTVLASTLTECQDDSTHDLSLALNDQCKSQALCQMLI